MPSRAERVRFPILLMVSLSDLETHGTGRAFHHPHGRFDSSAIEILQLFLRNFADLRLAHGPYAAAPGGLCAAVDLGRLLEKVGNRRSPHLERERAVLIDRDH